MKGTIEEKDEAISQLEEIALRHGRGNSPQIAIAYGLTAIAYAIRDLAIAVKSLSVETKK